MIPYMTIKKERVYSYNGIGVAKHHLLATAYMGLLL